MVVHSSLLERSGLYSDCIWNPIFPASCRSPGRASTRSVSLRTSGSRAIITGKLDDPDVVSLGVFIPCLDRCGECSARVHMLHRRSHLDLQFQRGFDDGSQRLSIHPQHGQRPGGLRALCDLRLVCNPWTSASGELEPGGHKPFPPNARVEPIGDTFVWDPSTILRFGLFAILAYFGRALVRDGRKLRLQRTPEAKKRIKKNGGS